MPRMVYTLLSLSIVVTLTTSLTAQGTIRYIYDELGRLVSVIDGAGDAAVYHYDAVGNLLSITRSTSTQVNVIEVTPDAGPIGQSVTIHGTGFSATAVQNTVSFNGTSATVSSASTTKLVVTVPSGATTGTVSVTSPNGSDTSDGPFTVTAGTGAPTITSFSPTSAVAGTSITITGTNFETASPTNNRPYFNRSVTGATAATTTTVTAAVPSGAGSGRISVKTPAGTAVSIDDIIIPPSPYVVADVASAARISLSTATTVTVSTANKIALRLFDATQGQRVAVLGTNGVTGQIIGCDLMVSLLTPFATHAAPPACMEGSGFIDATTLNTEGTHTILVDPGGAATGSVTLTLYNVPADYTATITPGGSSVTASMSTAGQNATLTFSGTANQRVSLVGTNGMTGQIGLACDVNVSIVKPDSSFLAYPTCMEGSGFIDVKTLPSTGTYKIFVNPTAAATGNLTLTLHDVPADTTGSITAGGSSVVTTVSTPGQNGTLTFSGTVGQRISLRGTNGMTGQIGLACDVNVTVFKPDATALAPATCMEGSGFLDAVALPATGTYTILVDPVAHAVGSLTLQLHDVPADTTGSVTVGGSAVAVPLGTPGQNGTLTFTGTATQQVTVRLTGNTYGQVTVKLLKPDGSQLLSSTSSASNFNLTTQTLPTSGTYTIVIDPVSANTGTINVSVTNP